MDEIIPAIDYALLREQKISLLFARNKAEDEGRHTAASHLSGVLQLIDSIQDEAHRQGFPAYVAEEVAA